MLKAGPALLVFQFIDTIMARRQLLGIRDRAEQFAARASNPEEPEAGSTDQYQLYEVFYASGTSAGVPGSEAAAKWRRAAVDDEILSGTDNTDTSGRLPPTRKE